jgi:helix-turn-helix protein
MNSNSIHIAGGYFRVQDRFFDWYGPLLGPIAIAVYSYLTRCADQDGCCFPSYEDIARKCGISRSSALRAIAKLVKYKLITVKHRRHRQEHRDDHTSNCYKIRLEAFTDKGAHREVVSQGHQVVSIRHQLVSQGHSKEYPIKGNPIKEKEREGGIPPSTPTLSTSLNSSQGEITQTAGENLEAAEAEKSPCPNDLIPAIKIAPKANGKPTTGRERQHQGNGAGQSLPASLMLSDAEIESAMREIGFPEAEVKAEASKFRDNHRSKGTLSCDWQAELRIWKQRRDEWRSRERDMRANNKVERTAPRPPVVVAEPQVPLAKPRPSRMPELLAALYRGAAQP